MIHLRNASVALLCGVVLAAGIVSCRSSDPRPEPAATTVKPASDAAVRPAPDGAAAADEDRAMSLDGVFGFSHEVASNIDGKMVMTMQEGPDGPQVRCQTEALPCSYLKLKALSQSGAEIPAALQMTREEVRTLVSQLDALSRHLERYHDNINQACLDGYRTRSGQVANMGFHMGRNDHPSVFDPEQPQMLLFARDGAEQLNQQQIGDCVDGKWTGDPHQTIVGAAYIQLTKDHPQGFAGPLDNWHIHYSMCIGKLSAATLSKEECEKRGAVFLPSTGWMLHAYVVPAFDNQVGVFSQWNPSVWPKATATTMAATQGHDMDSMSGHDMAAMPGHDMANMPGHDMTGVPGPAMGSHESTIFEFQFKPVEMRAGETVVFRNADPVFHSVTAGSAEQPSGAFDSGKLFNNQTFSLTLDKPGTYHFFCRFHPDMTGTLVVK